MIIQDNLSPEKHIDRIFGDTFRMLRNIQMAFHFLDKDMMRKIITSMTRPKLEYAEVIWSAHKKNYVLNLKEYRIETKMVPELEDLTCEERLKEMHLTTIKERGDLITIYELMNNLEKTDRKDLILRRKVEARNLRGHKKILQKGKCLNDTKKYSFPQRSIDIWNGLKEEVIMTKNAHQLFILIYHKPLAPVGFTETEWTVIWCRFLDLNFFYIVMPQNFTFSLEYVEKR